MYQLTIENHKGEQLQLTQNPNYTIINIDGLNPTQANINTAINANFDGSTFINSRLSERNIVIELVINGDIESNRIALYQFIKSKYQCTLYYSNNQRNVYIVGYIESFECNFFSEKETVQISIICPKPCFINQSQTDINFSVVNALFEFPFSIAEAGMAFSELVLGEEIVVVNSGDIETGMIIRFTATDTVVNPALYNVETQEFIKINITMSVGDVVEINTNKGAKSVTYISNGVTTNAINYIDRSSSWLQLESGDNIITYNADDYEENLMCTLAYNNLYEGV